MAAELVKPILLIPGYLLVLFLSIPFHRLVRDELLPDVGAFTGTGRELSLHGK